MNYKLLLFASLFLLSISVFSQDRSGPINFPDNVDEPLTKKEKTMIDEVYQSKAKKVVFDDEEFLKDIKHLLRNRITIYEDNNPETQKKCKLLSQVPLNTEYNENLKRDVKFDIVNFNPLKYQLDFFSKGTYLYRIDNTNYFILVTSQYRKLKK